MPELLQKVLTGVLRTFLAPLLVWLVNKNILTSGETAQLVSEIAIYAAMGAWALWAWVKAHRTQLTALAMPKGSTLEQLASKVKAGETAPVSTPKDATPIITKQLPVILLAIALGGSMLLSACAGNLHVDLIKAHQTIEAALTTADDTERVVCFGTKDLAQVSNPTHCTTGLAVTAWLTDAKHQEFHRLLSKAFAAQVRLGPVLQSWKGPGLPADLTEVLALADQITALARTFNPNVPDVSNLIKVVLQWQGELISLKQSISGGAL